VPTDVLLYREVANAIIAGGVPYRDFFLEYPPASLLAFIPPAFFTTTLQAYATFFASEMALVLVGTLVLTTYAARTLLGWWWPLSGAVFTAATLLIPYDLLLSRYDAVVALTLGVTMALTSRWALTAAWASLGFGTAFKLVPVLATPPLALLSGYRRGTRALGDVVRGIVQGFAVFVCVVAVFFMPALLLGGEGYIKSFAYHADRGLQIESLASSILMELGWLEYGEGTYGSYNVQGHYVEFLASMSLPITGALLMITADVMYREHRAGRFETAQFPRFAAAFVVAFLLGSKVLSPQYIIWLLPLVPLTATGVWGIGLSGVFLMICYMTRLVRDYREVWIGFMSPGTEVLLGRNLLLVLLWVLLLCIPSVSNPGAPSGNTARGCEQRASI